MRITHVAEFAYHAGLQIRKLATVRKALHRFAFQHATRLDPDYIWLQQAVVGLERRFAEVKQAGSMSQLYLPTNPEPFRRAHITLQQLADGTYVFDISKPWPEDPLTHLQGELELPRALWSVVVSVYIEPYGNMFSFDLNDCAARLASIGYNRYDGIELAEQLSGRRRPPAPAASRTVARLYDNILQVDLAIDQNSVMRPRTEVPVDEGVWRQHSAVVSGMCNPERSPPRLTFILRQQSPPGRGALSPRPITDSELKHVIMEQSAAIVRAFTVV